ncbi:hypothetical protein BG004_000613 [Podila humilis]|nr:hypothetical protein BG004_000613 [Podila humilis]
MDDEPTRRSKRKTTKRVHEVQRIASSESDSEQEEQQNVKSEEENDVWVPAEEIMQAATPPKEQDIEPPEEDTQPVLPEAEVEVDAYPMEELAAVEADVYVDDNVAATEPEHEAPSHGDSVFQDADEDDDNVLRGVDQTWPEPDNPVETSTNDLHEPPQHVETERTKSETTVQSPFVKAKPAIIPDFEEPGGVPQDPSTPVRTAASKLDGDDWVLEDSRRESGQSQMTSPFLSPSQWVDLTSSTPKSRKTPILLGHTPRQRFKDMIGGSPTSRSPIRRGNRTPGSLGFPILASPSIKRKVKPSLSPDAKHNRLVDQFEHLMQDNATMEVMAMAEKAVMEETKLLKRSQNKERRQAETSKQEEDMDTESAGARRSPEHTNLFLQSTSTMRTPTKKQPSSGMMDIVDLSPVMSINRTPHPISKVISAIGAASRRANPDASPVPFVRTPINKKVQVLRLEDMDIEPQVDGNMGATSDEQPREPNEAVQARTEDISTIEGSSSSRTDSSQPLAAPPKLNFHKIGKRSKDIQEDIKDGTKGSSREAIEGVVQNQRAQLLHEANITEKELQMTVEEYHRALVAQEIKELEMAAETWVLKFEEESNRVRMALLEGSELM